MICSSDRQPAKTSTITPFLRSSSLASHSGAQTTMAGSRHVKSRGSVVEHDRCVDVDAELAADSINMRGSELPSTGATGAAGAEA